MLPTCPTTNNLTQDQSSFWSNGSIHWDAHRIGWAVAGGCALLTCLITAISVFGHARNYIVPTQQRQIIRILYMPPVFAIISFFSYRFFRDFTYYELVQAIYEAFTISAFMLLIIQFVAETSSTKSTEGALVRKDKQPLPIPFCCWRYRPTKPYFMYTIKWSVLQYAIIRPAVSIAGIICEALDILCESSYSPHFANVYLAAIDFTCISVALYGLFLFYSLTSEELRGRRPFAKFVCIKLIVFLTFYQSFLFSTLQDHGIIKGTEFWTATNVSNGLNALTTTIEMVFFALLMMWAYPWKEYRERGDGVPTSIGRPLLDSLNFSDFALEILGSFRFFVAYARHEPGSHSRDVRPEAEGQRYASFGTAFDLHGGTTRSQSPSRRALRDPEAADGEERDSSEHAAASQPHVPQRTTKRPASEQFGVAH